MQLKHLPDDREAGPVGLDDDFRQLDPHDRIGHPELAGRQPDLGVQEGLAQVQRVGRSPAPSSGRGPGTCT